MEASKDRGVEAVADAKAAAWAVAVAARADVDAAMAELKAIRSVAPCGGLHETENSDSPESPQFECVFTRPHRVSKILPSLVACFIMLQELVFY